MILCLLITSFVSFVFVFGIVTHNTMRAPVGFEDVAGFHFEAVRSGMRTASSYSGPERRMMTRRAEG
jgi:hypothetical protein